MFEIFRWQNTFSITVVLVSTRDEVFLKDIFHKYEDISNEQLLMIPHFLNKFIKETFYFCGCWMFQNKWINESVPPSLCRGLSPTNIGKKIVSTNFWQIFKTQFWQIFILSPPIIMRGKRGQKSCSTFEYIDCWSDCTSLSLMCRIQMYFGTI